MFQPERPASLQTRLVRSWEWFWGWLTAPCPPPLSARAGKPSQALFKRAGRFHSRKELGGGNRGFFQPKRPASFQLMKNVLNHLASSRGSPQLVAWTAGPTRCFSPESSPLHIHGKAGSTTGHLVLGVAHCISSPPPLVVATRFLNPSAQLPSRRLFTVLGRRHSRKTGAG